MADLVPPAGLLAAYVVAVVALALTPGPDMGLFLGKAVTAGRAAGTAAMLGAATGLLIHTLLVALGLSAVLAASSTAFLALKIAGAAWLAWLAIDAVRRGSSLRLEGGGPPERLRWLYLKGLGVNLLNPKIILFFATFLPQFVRPEQPRAAATLVFLGLLFVTVAVPICLLMILFADRLAETARRSPRAMRAVDWVFAAVMAGFALRLLLTRGE